MTIYGAEIIEDKHEKNTDLPSFGQFHQPVDIPGLVMFPVMFGQMDMSVVFLLLAIRSEITIISVITTGVHRHISFFDFRFSKLFEIFFLKYLRKSKKMCFFNI